MSEGGLNMFRWTKDILQSSGSIQRLFLAALLTVGLVACNGEDGPAGLDGTSPDSSPPAVALLSPAAGDTARETLQVVAGAVDNIAVDRVVFFLDGSDQVDDTTYAEVSGLDALDNQYVWTFNLLDLGVETGPHTVMARAFDLDQNHSDTPPIFIYSDRQIPAGPTVLRVWEPDSLGFYTFPNRDPGDETIILDRMYSTRFRPLRDCSIDSVRLYLSTDAISTVNYDTTLIITVHESNGVFPIETAILGQTVLNVAGLDTSDTTGWFSATFTDLDPIDAGTLFHVSVNTGAASDTTQFALGVSIVDKYEYPLQSYSTRYVDDENPHWESLQEQFPIGLMTREFMIEVWVTYE
ncbi:MAG TPA: hypothetical protein ENH10_01320 [Bacteroidetes bacterium]|nr:hypothetical protein BMS3Bbin04_01785 [bacterium BMS3Bbin04]HDO64660.1 hypothetical protein [Bacteroidota bacterium]HEX03785.1 hypothetical protein [Bacteroidota bacterium]